MCDKQEIRCLVSTQQGIAVCSVREMVDGHNRLSVGNSITIGDRNYCVVFLLQITLIWKLDR